MEEWKQYKDCSINSLACNVIGFKDFRMQLWIRKILSKCKKNLFRNIKYSIILENLNTEQKRQEKYYCKNRLFSFILFHKL